MPMRRSTERRHRLARDVGVNLPLKGAFSDAGEAETNGQYAAQLVNLRSTGLLLETVPAFTYESAAGAVTSRASFDFGLSPSLLAFEPSVIRAPADYARTNAAYPSIAAISSNLLIADDQGEPLRFDGETFTACDFTTTTEADPDTFDGIIAHHDIPYLWKRGGPLEFYYGETVGAVTGELTRFPLDRLGNISGGMHSMASFTLDAGHGINDVLAIFTTTGDVVVYEGLDPGDDQDWRLSGRFRIAPPVGTRAFANVGGDLWILTRSGVVSLVTTIRQNAMALVSQVTRPVMQEIIEAMERGGEWQLHAAANSSMVIVNWFLGGTAKQWVYFPESQTWGSASYPARHWHNHLGNTEFTSGDGRLCRITYTQGAGEPMTAVLHTGWIRAGGSGITAIIPTIKAKGSLTVRLAVLSDHDETAADLDEAWQTVTLEPETDPIGGETIRLGDEFGCDASGDVYQIRMEVTAPWAQIINLRARAV